MKIEKIIIEYDVECDAFVATIPGVCEGVGNTIEEALKWALERYKYKKGKKK